MDKNKISGGAYMNKINMDETNEKDRIMVLSIKD